MLEYEKKFLFSEQEYMILLSNVGQYAGQAVQHNYYYDTDKLLYNREGITYRIREKNGRFTATVKTHRIDAQDCSQEESYLAKNPFDIAVFNKPNLKLYGCLTTFRTILHRNDFIVIALDRNVYLDCQDYELEIEYAAGYEEAAEKQRSVYRGFLLEKSDAALVIPLCKSKSERFFERFTYMTGLKV